MKVLVAAIVLVVALVFLAASCGDFYAWGEVDFDGPVDPAAFSAGAPATLAAPSTRAQRRWVARVNAECARRNRRAAAVPAPNGGPQELTLYADELLGVLREYRKRTASYEVPNGYADEAAWHASVDRAYEEAIQDVFFGASDADRDAAEAGVDAVDWITAGARDGLLRIGLRACSRF